MQFKIELHQIIFGKNYHSQTMDSDRWKQIENIFQAALDLSGDERENFVRSECGDDVDLRREVEKYISRFETEDSFLESPVWTDSQFLQSQVKRDIISSLKENEHEPSVESFIGRQIGVYRLTEELGKGGMGVVYLGERADGEFQQKVAIKLIKRGMDTDFIVKRFRHERQIAATLNHPNIARLLDGGTTEDDLPYFVLEYVEGEGFFKYTEKHQLDLRSKLELFLQICAAIAYAHRKKIIHRDIKPGNILISEDGLPKLLDFGIAKILDPDLIHESILPTGTQMRLMTPEYASPEQVRGEEITTASDQYSLGVLLYELITGTRPYKFPSRSPHEIARVICEEIPSEPSSGEFGKLTGENGKLSFDRDFCRKLDRIVLKTLRKNPAERYVSVVALASDIERFLRNETVRAESFTGEEEKFALPPAPLTETPETNPVAANQTLVAKTAPQVDETIFPRWAGIKQGFFLMILALIALPFLLVLTVTGFIAPQLTIFLFLLIFLGGIIRIVYALLFEPPRAAPSLLPEGEKSFAANTDPTRLFPISPTPTTVENRRQTSGDFTAPDGKTIAVLPFKNLGALTGKNTDSGDFLSIGLADALITRLSGVNQLIVRPTSSILKFAAENTDEFAAGDELQAQFLLVGNILRVENKIRVSVQMLDVAKQRTIWAERLTENLTDVLTLEDKISEKVVNQLLPQLSIGEREKLAKRGTDEPKAYEAYLRGRFYWNSFTEDSFAKAFVAYQEAISHDPNYALAYAGIADYYIWLGVYGVLPPQECYPSAKDAARRAVELDDELAEAFAALGFAQLCGDFDWIEAEKNAVRAIEINPHYAVARLWYSYLLQSAGHFEEGIEQAKRAVALDPLTYTNHHVLSWAYYFARRFDEADRQIAETVKKFPNVGLAHFTQSWFLRFTGDHEAALETSQRAVELSGDSLFVLLGHAQALAAAGKKSEAAQTLQRIFEQQTRQYLSYYQVALVHVYTGEIEKALDALERTYEDREGWLIWVRCEPALDKLRDEPRFINLRKKIDRRAIEIINDKKDEDNFELKEITGANQKSIAVLPFKFLTAARSETADSEEEFLGIGLADALITRLSNMRQFIVRPTSSILAYGARGTDSLAAGAALNVKYILDGTVIKTESKYRVSVQFLDVERQSSILAERFEEDLLDVLNLEDKISLRVTESLIPKLNGEDRANLAKRGTENARAYEAYLRGRANWNTFTEDGLQKAITYYNEAIRLDPNYAAAHAAIADYYVWLGMYSLLPVEKFYPPAKKSAERAIELDPHSSEAHAALGLAALYGKYDWQTSEANMRRAIELNPNNSVAHLWFTHNLYTSGKFDEGKTHLNRALELDPLSFQNHNTLAWALYFERRFDEAIAKADDLIDKFPTASYSYFGKSMFLRFIGEYEESLKNSYRALEFSGDALFSYYGHASALAAAGRRDEALKIIENTPPGTYLSDYHAAIVYCCLKEKDKAFEMLEKGVAARESTLVWLGVEPSLDFLRDDERYWSLLKRINHPLAKAKIVSESAISKKMSAPVSADMPDEKTIVQTETKAKKRISSAVKYLLAAFVLSFLSVFGFIIYYFATHTTFGFSATPTNRQWKNNFASLMNVKLLTSSGKEQLAAVAPDGGRVAFVSEKDETNSLWIRQIDSENAVLLVAPESVLFVGLKFSPDGKYVYYTTSSHDYAQRILWRIAVDAANNQPQKVLDNVNGAIGIAPDGKRIAYYNFDAKSKLMNMLIADLKDDATMQSLKIVATRLQPDYFFGNPAFSPDGSKIVYPAATVAGQKETVNLYEFNFAANAEKKIGERDFNDIGAIEWRENGTELVISANEKNTDPLQLWLISYPSGEISRLTNDLHNYYGVSLTKNSDALVTIKRATISNVAVVSWEKGSTFNRLIIEGVERQDGIEGVNWTADNGILYISSSGGKNAVTLVNADGTNSRIINLGDALPSNPLLTGDGRFIFFIDQRGQESKLRRYEMATGAIAEIIPQYTMTPTLMPDDKHIIYSAFNAERKTTLHRVSVEGGAATELTSVRSLNPVVSPDNKFIACYYTNDKGDGWRIGIFPIDGGAPVQTLDPLDTVNLHSPLESPLAWSSDSRRIYYVNDKGGVSNIFRVTADGTNKTEQITNFPSGIIFDFSLAPDQKRAVVARGSTSSDIVLFKTSR